MAKQSTENQEPEKVTEETSETQIRKPKRTLVSGADYHDFELNPIFQGKFLNEFIAEVDEEDEKGKKTGNKVQKCIGFLMVNEDGEECLISNSHAIEKGFNLEYEPGKTVKSQHDWVEIEFLGKETLRNGKPYNKFKVSLL